MLKRFGVSLEEDLLEKFDTLIEEKGYNNRSEAIRDLIRGELLKKEWADDQQETAGALFIVYDHHKHELSRKITNTQHQHYNNIISSMHIHLDHDNCLEVVALKGKAREIQQVANSLLSAKGVKCSEFIKVTAGKNF